MAVVAAVEFHDFVAPGEAAGEPDGGHGRLCAAIDHADLLDAGDPTADEGGHLDLARVRNAEADAMRRGLADGVDNHGGRMAQDRGAPCADVIEVLIAIDIPDAGVLSALHEERLAAYAAEGADGGIDAAGDELLGEMEIEAGLGVVHERNGRGERGNAKMEIGRRIRGLA